MRRSLHPQYSLPWSPLALATLVCLFALLAWGLSIDAALLLFGALCGTGLVTFVAYSHPRLTIVLTFIAGTLLDGSRFITFEPTVAGLQLRYFDPVLLGILGATALKLFLGDKRLFRLLSVRLPTLSLLLLWLIVTAFRSVTINDPVATFGEFRTYHQFLFFPLYVVAFFPTRESQWRLFKLLLLLSFLIIPWGLLSIPFTEGISFASFGPDMRFIHAVRNLSLLWGVVGLYIVDRQKLITLKAPLFYGLVLSFGLFTLVNNHRSVWLATAASLVLLWLFRHLSTKRQLQVGVGLFAGTLLLGLAPTSFTTELARSLQTRASVFTDFQQDDTAFWRFTLWQRATEEIREQPVLGVGLGRHFQLADPEGDIITTSPHNEYITLAFHTGITGLVFYTLFLINLLLLLRARLLRKGPASERAIVFTTLLIIAVVSLFYIAYTAETDFLTWLYIGLGVAVVTNKSEAQLSPERGL